MKTYNHIAVDCMACDSKQLQSRLSRLKHVGKVVNLGPYGDDNHLCCFIFTSTKTIEQLEDYIYNIKLRRSKAHSHSCYEKLNVYECSEVQSDYLW
jgi:hypothetical protein